MITFRMLARSYGARIVAGLVAATGMLAIADFTDVAPSLAGRAHALSIGLHLYAAKMPGLVLQALPLAVLFGVLITVAALAKSGELLALRAAGAGPLRLAAPALACALLLCGPAIWVADGPAPRATREATRIEAHVLGRTSFDWWRLHAHLEWYAGDEGTLYSVGHVGEAGHVLSRVIRFDLRNGHFTRIATAPTVTWADGSWHADDPQVWTFGPDPRTVGLDTASMPIDEDPLHFAGGLGAPDELTLGEIERTIEVRRDQGLPTLELRVEQASRQTMPLLGLALALLALGLALVVHTPGSAMEAGAIGIGVAFAGWTLLALCRALGLANVIGPATAAWIPLLVPAVLGMGLLSLARMR